MIRAGHDGAEISIEPARFGMTGRGISDRVRSIEDDDALAYAIDAPQFVARGSTRSSRHVNCHYISTSDVRAWW